MENNTRKKTTDESKNTNISKDKQASTLNQNTNENEQTHRHSKLDKAIITFQLENIIIKLPHLTSFIVDLQIDDSKLIFSPKSTDEENNFYIGYHMQKIITARINNSHTRAKARKIFISVSCFNKDKKKIGSGKIEIHPGSFYGEEKLKLRPISIDLSTIEPCPLFFFGLQLNDIPDENPEENDQDNHIPQLQNFELPDTLVSTKRRTAHRGSDTELMTDLEKEKAAKKEEEEEKAEKENQDEENENESDEEFFVFNNPDLIAMIEAEEAKRRQEEERKKQEEERRRQEEEERKRQEELKRKQDEERKKIEKLRRMKEEEERKKQEEIKRKIDDDKKRQLEKLMQRSSKADEKSTTAKLQHKLKNKKKFVDCLSKNACLLKDAMKAINSLDIIKEKSIYPCSLIKYKKIKRSLSTIPKKVTKPSLVFPLKIAPNFAFSYSYRLPTDENGNVIENAPFYPQNVELNNLIIIKKWRKSAFKSIKPKSKTTDEVIDYEKQKQKTKDCNEILNKFSDSENINTKCEMKKYVESFIGNSNRDSIVETANILPLFAKANINIDSNNNHAHRGHQLNFNNDNNNNYMRNHTGHYFLSDSFINNSYNSYRNDTNRQALFLLSNENDPDIPNSSSIIANNDFIIDEICAKHGDVDNDENGKFRTRYESLQRQSKIRFILAKMRRYNPQNRPDKLTTDNLIFHEWTTNISSDDDNDYEYYDYE